MESLQLGENIGEGEFGSVHKAVYMTEDGEERDVAVKVSILCFLIITLKISYIFVSSSRSYYNFNVIVPFV